MKVGEDGLVPRTGAEFMALETTAEAGTCLACKSMLGLVGSSMRMEGVVDEGGRKLSLLVPHPQTCSRPSPHPPSPSTLQRSAGNMPMAKGAPPTRLVMEAWPLPPPSHEGHQARGSASLLRPGSCKQGLCLPHQTGSF